MIKYTLQCSSGHRFDAWFGNSESCDDQMSAGLVACVDCNDSIVIKAPMAPAIAGSKKRRTAPAVDDMPPPDAGETSVVSSAPTKEVALAGQVREALHMLRRYVEKNSDYVGDRFADEARKIHHGETDERGIYGETTPKEAEELLEEGVPFGSLPWPRNDT